MINKQTIIELLKENHHSFINYVDELPVEEYEYQYQQKWTAGQQMEHMILCVKALAQAYNMDTIALEKTFGKTDRTGRSYEALRNEYDEKTAGGGAKAPERFTPKNDSQLQREALGETLSKLVNDLSNGINKFSEEELDTLLMPHPLLGQLTLREMLYNAIYHVQHHHELTRVNLSNK